MGKVLVTNNSSWSDLLRKCWNGVGFQENNFISNKNNYCTIYRKLNINNINWFTDGIDYVAAVGTMFYKKKFAEDALKLLLADAKSLGVKELRKDLVGSYAVVIKIANTIKIFLDETHTYDLYYYHMNNNYLITNTYYHIEKCVKEPMNYDAFLERGIRGGISGLRTPYANIYSLSAREYIEIDLDKNEFVVKKCELNDFSCNFNNRQEAIECIWERSQEVAALRSKYIKRYLQFVTGGIDSRLELAANLYNRDDVTLGYWMGNDVITNGTQEDKEIEKEIGEAFSLEYKCYDVAESFEQVMSGMTIERSDKYGEYASKYTGNRKWFSIFEELKDVEFLGFGYFGETLRELAELDRNYCSGYKVDDFVKDVYCRTGLEKAIFISDTLYKYVMNEFDELLSLDGRNECTKDEYFRAFTYSRYAADCLLTNICNMFVYSFPVLGTKMVSDAIFSVPYEWRKGDNISIALTGKWERRLLDIPYYSHHHRILCDTDEMQIRETKSNILKEKIQPFLMNTKLYDTLYLGFLQRFVRPQSVKNREIYALCIEILEQSPIFNDSGIVINHPKTWKGVELATLASFVSDVKVAENLFYNNERE